MERNIQTLAELFDTFGYKTKDTPRAIWREVFGEGLPDLSTKVTDDVIKEVCAFLSVEKKGRSGKIVETAKGLLGIHSSDATKPKRESKARMSGGTNEPPTDEKHYFLRNGNGDIVRMPESETIVPDWRKFNDEPHRMGGIKEELPKENPKPPFDWKHLLFAIFCVAYAIVHAVLIWYDCIVLWPGKTTIGPGMIGGGLAFIFQMGVLVLAFDDTRGRTSSYALFVLLLVDIGAVFLHYPTFIQGSEVGQTVTMVFCGFVCLLSFSSLYLLRDSKIF